jgi:hypothetical protein
MATSKGIVSGESPAVQSHLGILQSVIQRMSMNSSSAKAWCITLVSAILVLVADKSKPQYAWIAAIPTFLFFVLDAYYLGLEKGFRAVYNDFICKLHGNDLAVSDLYQVSPKGSVFLLLMKSILSFSVWPFYLTLVAMIYVVKVYVM